MFLRHFPISHSNQPSVGYHLLRASFASVSVPKWTETLNKRLQDVDPEIHSIIKNEENRQKNSIILIPSENFTSVSVLDALGSVMQNKYSEGLPGQRYYGGNEFIDQAERLCQQRALELFQLDPEKWGVNVQPLSGAPANFYIYTACLQPHDRILALDLPSGGHLSHGYQLPTKKVSAVSKYFETVGYRLDPNTGEVNYDEMELLADFYRPKLIVCGGSAYARDWDFARFRKVADQHGAYLLADMSHISGLIASGIGTNPFDYCDVFMSTSHKILRGPRGAFIIYRKGVRSVDKKGNEILYDLDEKINASVFPGHQGGPHNHTITALAVALKMASTPEYKNYTQQVVKNSKYFATALMNRGFNLLSGGTDNHLVLVDLRNKSIDGARVEYVLELCGIAVNKNTVPGDKSALMPSGLRMGTPPMTTRGFVENDFDTVANFLDRGVNLALEFKSEFGPKLKEFKSGVNAENPKIQELKQEVSDFASSFPTIGVL